MGGRSYGIVESDRLHTKKLTKKEKAQLKQEEKEYKKRMEGYAEQERKWKADARAAVLANCFDVSPLYHHIHNNDHTVHHCGGETPEDTGYRIKHCKCGKHSSNKKELHLQSEAWRKEENFIICEEECPHGGWHLEVAWIKKKD